MVFDMKKVLKELKRTLRIGRNERNQSSFKIQLTLTEIKIFNSVILKVFRLLSSFSFSFYWLNDELPVWLTGNLGLRIDVRFGPDLVWTGPFDSICMPVSISNIQTCSGLLGLGYIWSNSDRFDIENMLHMVLYNIFEWTKRLSKRYQY